MTIKYITDIGRIALAKGTGGRFVSQRLRGYHGDRATCARTKGQIELKYEFERNGQTPEIPPMLDTINFNDTLKGKLVYSDVTPTGPGLTLSMGHRYLPYHGRLPLRPEPGHSQRRKPQLRRPSLYLVHDPKHDVQAQPTLPAAD